VPPASRFPGAAPGSSPSHRAARCAALARHQPWRAQRTTQSCAGHVSSRPRESEAARSGGLPGRQGQQQGPRPAGDPAADGSAGTEGRRTCPAGDCPPAPLTRGQDFLARPRARPRDNDTAPRGPLMDLSWTCRRPAANLTPRAPRRVCRSDIPVTSAPAGREPLSDGGVPGRGGTDPVSPHCSMCYSAEVDLQQTDGSYAL
jgi:hypothetical protein